MIPEVSIKLEQSINLNKSIVWNVQVVAATFNLGRGRGLQLAVALLSENFKLF